MKNLVVLLGAGASAGAANAQNSGEDWSPPITREIFDVRFRNILYKYERISGLSGIGNEITTGGELESYLERHIGLYSQYTDLPPNKKLQINQLPLYLQNLFIHVSNTFKTSSYYRRFVNVIFTQEDIKVTFITLNYDLLLDYAIEKSLNLELDDFTKYYSQEQRWSLIKPHGSINWMSAINNDYGQAGHDFGSWKSIVDQMDVYKDVDQEIFQVVLNGSSNDVLFFNEGFVSNMPVYPKLAIPNGEYEMVFPTINFKEVMERNLKEANSYLIIGFSGYDEGLLNMLNTRVTTVKKLLIVGKTNAHNTYENIVKIAPVFKRDKPAEAEYNAGFEEFIKEKDGTSDLENFINSL